MTNPSIEQDFHTDLDPDQGDGDIWDEDTIRVTPKAFELGHMPFSGELHGALFSDDVACVVLAGKPNEEREEFEGLQPSFYRERDAALVGVSEADLGTQQYIAAGRLLIEPRHHEEVIWMCHCAGLTAQDEVFVAHLDGFSMVGLIEPTSREYPTASETPKPCSRVMSVFRWPTTSNHEDIIVTDRLRRFGPMFEYLLSRMANFGERVPVDCDALDKLELNPMVW